MKNKIIKIKNIINEENEILANIKWFLKFPLEKRLEISQKDTEIISKLKKLKIKDNERSH